jgi:uncharacterized membrane protein YccF (DUF307 family)
MHTLGNILFFILGGFLITLGYFIGGIILCITIIGIPFGLQCFKMAGAIVAPFGKEVREKPQATGPVAMIMNIIWIILPGLELAIAHLILALIFGITIVGIPLAKQHIKLLPMALIPFGRYMTDV